MTLDPDVLKQNKYTGVAACHEAGIRGGGVVVWNSEDMTDHGIGTRNRILHAAPEATVLQASLNMVADNEKIITNRVDYEGKSYTAEEFIKTFRVKIINRSVGGGFSKDTDTPRSRYWRELKEKYNLIFTVPSGNEGSESKYDFRSELAIVVGAAELRKTGPAMYINSSSALGMGFVTFMGFQSGTSFSAPYLAGQIALICQRYGLETTQEGAYELLKRHCEDMKETGYDIYSGWGIPHVDWLVNVKTPTAPQESALHEIKLKIGSKIMIVDGKEVTMDVAPYIKDKRTMLPVRWVAEALGKVVGWNNDTKEVTIKWRE